LYSTIIVAVSANSHSETMLRTARDLALLTSATVHLVHVSAQEWIEGQELTFEDVGSVDAFVEQALSSFTKAGISATYSIVPADSRDIGKAILEEAERGPAPLIVIGAHHRHAWLPLLGQSISDRIAHDSPHAVLLVP
jgi:nucleotide-binding universal stress UspA family protein